MTCQASILLTRPPGRFLFLEWSFCLPLKIFIYFKNLFWLLSFCIVLLFSPEDLEDESWSHINRAYSGQHKNILAVIDLLLTLPGLSAEVERGFSQLKNIKGNLRSKLTDQHLNNVLCIKLHSKPVGEFDPSKAIDHWNYGTITLRRPLLHDKRGQAKSTTSQTPTVAEPESSGSQGVGASATRWNILLGEEEWVRVKHTPAVIRIIMRKPQMIFWQNMWMI